METRTVAVIQARMGSTRLPGKILRQLAGRTVLAWVVRAALAVPEVDEVVVATTSSPDDDPTALVAEELGVRLIRGSESDVLSRFLLAVEHEAATTAVIRLTADCPLLDPTVISMCARAFDPSELDHLSTIAPRSLPRGLDVEVTSVRALRELNECAEGADRVHVTSRLYRQPGEFNTAGLTFSPGAADLRVTLDTPADWNLLERLVAEIGDRPPSWRALVDVLRRRGDLVSLNAHVEQKPLEAG